MKAEIQKKLEEIERTENVRIIHCIESGSRARGYSVPDSDYDVRFVYVRPVEHYLRLESKKDVIEWQLDDTFDISGWDIQKYLRLTYASNASVYEWAASGVIYKTTEYWQNVFSLLPGYFDPKSVIHHCLSLAQGQFGKSLSYDTVRIKKYIHVLLPLLQCRYILKNGVYPPIGFTELISSELDSALLPLAEMLLRERQNGETIKRADELNSYIESSIDEIRSAVDELPARAQHEWKKLDICFVDTIKNVWGGLYDRT